MIALFRRCHWYPVALALILIAAEAAARLDDWVFSAVPLLAHPNRERDLTTRDEHGLHGQPGGVFKKWKLNQHGFRGPEMDLQKQPDTVRMLILGASETFGLYESEGKEYPAQLQNELAKLGKPKVEVINAAMAGITVKSMVPYWNQWVAKTRPDVVLIYPSPLFYLDEELPRDPGTGGAAPQFKWSVKSRFFDRVNDSMRRSELVRKIRLHYLLTRKLAGKGDDYFFRKIPEDRLLAFEADLDAMIGALQDAGVRPVLVTHACKASDPPCAEDADDLLAMRPYLLRAEPAVMTAFEKAANEKIRELAKKRASIVDLDAELSTRREYFADLVHFNDIGAAEAARVLAKRLTPILHTLGEP